MTALTADRDTDRTSGENFEYPVAAAKTIYGGSIVFLDSSGNAEPATAATGKIPAGRCDKYVDNSGGLAAAVKVKCRKGVFWYTNSGTNTLTKANIGDTVYAEDDQTVGSLATGMSAVGVMLDIDSTQGVLVDMRPSSIVSGLAAANNLSDVGSVATARANLGANKVVVPLRVTNLVGASTKAYSFVSPVAGDIAKIWSALNGAALAGGDATITGDIGGVAITGGVITITQAGSAEGDIDSATPSAANTVAVGDLVKFTVGGTNTDADAFANLTVYIET